MGAGLPVTSPTPPEEPAAEIQTCSDWRGDGLALHEIRGGTRHRWHCLDCDEKGPAEVDGAVCKWQLKQHITEKHSAPVREMKDQ